MTARTLTQLVVVALVSAAAVSGAGLPPTTDVPLPGTKIRLNDTTGRVGRRTYVALRDGDQVVPLLDPRVTGATAYIGRVGAGDVTVIDMPAADWGGTATGRADYKFKSRSGPILQARILEGRSVRFSAYGDGAYPLDGTPQGGVGVIIEVGDVRFCGFFGGRITKDDGKSFRARKAPAPAGCPVLGTTTTTTSTTTTSTTSTSTTTSTTTTTLCPGVYCLCSYECPGVFEFVTSHRVCSPTCESVACVCEDEAGCTFRGSSCSVESPF